MAHEIIGAITGFFALVLAASALSPKAKTNDILNTSFTGVNSLGKTISAPVM